MHNKLDLDLLGTAYLEPIQHGRVFSSGVLALVCEVTLAGYQVLNTVTIDVNESYRMRLRVLF